MCECASSFWCRSEAIGKKEFYLSKSSNLNTFHREGSAKNQLTGEAILVDTYSVPEIARLYGKPDLIRMDVEGHEVEVINGMLSAIEANEISPMIIFETHRSCYSKEHDMEATLRRLFAANYYVSYLGSSMESGTQRINARGYQGSAPIKTDFVNRVIYENIKPEDAIDLICHTGGVARCY